MPKQRIHSLVVLLLILAPALASPSSSDAEAPVPAIPDLVSVELRAHATPEDGATSEVASAGQPLHVGERGSAYLLTGSFDEPGPPRNEMCTSSVGSGAPADSREAGSVHVWRAAFTVVAATMEEITVEVEWSRDTARTRGAHERVRGDSRRITLREGQAHTLDVIQADQPDRCADSLRVDLSAQIEEDPRFERERLVYDVWLLDEDGSAGGASRHFRTSARHGEEVGFSFPALHWELVRPEQGGARARVLADVSGQLRGRLREDGSIDLILDAHRQLGVVLPTELGARGGIGDGGRKALRLREGETLGLILPRPQGSHAIALDGSWGSTFGAKQMRPTRLPPGSPDGVTWNADSVSVDFPAYLADHRMSLRVTARREEAE